MPKYSNSARAKFMADLDKLFNILDPSGANTKYYHDKWDNVSDKEFDKWVQWLDCLEHNFYWETIEYKRDAKLENIVKAAEAFNIPLYERVAVPYLNGTEDNVVVTPDPVPVGWIHVKRLPQTIHHKNSGSTSITKRNMKTGQVTGEDKNGRITDVETYALTSYGAEESLKELLGFRSDDEAAKNQAYADLMNEGVVYLNRLQSSPEDKAAINTLDVYYTSAGMKTNIISGSNLIMSPRKPLKI